jgi:hypothetical protein
MRKLNLVRMPVPADDAAARLTGTTSFHSTYVPCSLAAAGSLLRDS